MNDIETATAEFSEAWTDMLGALGPAAEEHALAALGNMAALFRSVTATAEADVVRAGVAFEALAAMAAALPLAIANSNG